MIAAQSVLITVGAATMTCWLWRSLMTLRMRCDGDDGEVDRQMHLLGGHGRVTATAAILTALALGALFLAPDEADRDLQDVQDLRRAAASCAERESRDDPPLCLAMQPGGQWAIEQRQRDGTRMTIATVARPSFDAGTQK